MLNGRTDRHPNAQYRRMAMACLMVTACAGARTKSGHAATQAPPPPPAGASLVCGDTALLRGQGPSGEKLLPLTDRLRVSVNEARRDSTGGSRFELRGTTVQNYSGLIPLHGLVYHVPGRILYFPLGVLSPSYGPDMIGPASGSCQIPLRLGETMLEVRTRGQADRYRVTLTDTTVVVQPVEQPRATILEDSVHRRIRARSFWFECAGDESRAAWCRSTRSAIASVPGVTADSFPGPVSVNPYGPFSSRRLFYRPDTGQVFSLVLSRLEQLGWRRDRRCDDFYVQLGNSNGILFQFYGCRATILEKSGSSDSRP